MAAKKKTKVEEPVVEVQEELTEVVEEPKTEAHVIFGKVSNCNKHNVRKKPNATAKVVAVIEAKTKVRIDNTASNE